MPTDDWGPVLRMLEALGLVAVVAVPGGLLGWRFGRRTDPDALPAPSTDNPAHGVAFLTAFLGYQMAVSAFGRLVGVPHWLGVPPETDAGGVWRSAFGSLLTAPVVLVGWLGFRGGWHRPSARLVAVGVAGWLLVSLPVYAVNSAAERASTAAGVGPRPHPLAAADLPAGVAPALVLLAAVCVATAFAEEVLFRGLLLGPLVRRPEYNLLPAGLGVAFAWLTTPDTPAQLPAVGWAVLLGGGLVVVRRRPRTAAVWSTSLFFAAVHSNVWPSPVPLFLLGLALGAVAVRTGGVLAGTVLHGLFNAVSLVCLLRG